MLTSALQPLRVAAAAQLAVQYTAPQRYGTAFHSTVPYADVRQLPLTNFTPHSSAADAATLPPADVAALARLTQYDAYGLWQLSHSAALPPLVVRVRPGEQATWHVPAGGATHDSRLIWIVLEAGARLTVFDTTRASTLLLQRVLIRQHEQSELTWWSVTDSAGYTSERVQVELLGRGATATVTHLVVDQPHSQADLAVRVAHQVPLTHATVRVRAAAQHKSTTIYRGELSVARRAAGTESYQQGRALLLGPGAVVDILPELAIAAHEVRCSHGVTMLHLDDEALFYLRSRGLPRTRARWLAIRGFFWADLNLPRPIVQALEAAIDSAYGQ